MTEKFIEQTELMNTLREIEEDMSVPKNVRIRVQNTINTLKQDSELQIKINKALNELELIADDVGLQSYTRTKIWNALSLLEKG